MLVYNLKKQKSGWDYPGKRLTVSPSAMGEGEGAGESEERLQAAMGLTLQ